MDNLSIFSYNYHGLNDKNKRTKLFLWINDQNYDIVLLQETFLINETEAYVKSSWKGISFFANSDSKHSRGVAVLLTDGRILLVNIEFNENVFTIVSVYAPNTVKECVMFFDKCHVL